MQAEIITGYVEIYATWENFIYPTDRAFSYEDYKKLPRALNYQGSVYLKTSYNSDTGTVAYKKANEFNLSTVNQ